MLKEIENEVMKELVTSLINRLYYEDLFLLFNTDLI